MIDRLLIDISPGSVRIAALADQKVEEFYHHRYSSVANVGAIFRARVTHILSSSKVVFLNIGLEQPAILSQSRYAVEIGQIVLVKIVQPARLDKGAKAVIVNDEESKIILGADTVFSDTIGCIVQSEHPINTCLRLYKDTLKNIVCTPIGCYKTFGSIVHDKHHIPIEYSNRDIFHDYGVDDVIEASLEPIVNLSGGARLIIEDTAAFTAVDIDSGSLSPNKANDTAVLVLADEMRRRALGGAIIVDLIPCKGRGSYIKRLRELVARDPVPTRVIGLTPEGRIEINRRRIRLSLEDELLDRNAKTSLSPITIGLEALRRCVRLALADGSTNVTVIAHPIVINLLKTTLKTAFLEAVYTLKVSIRLEESENLKVAFYDILVK